MNSSQSDQYTEIIQPQRITIKGFQSLIPQFDHQRSSTGMSSSSKLKNFMSTDTKKKWKKKIQTNFSGLAPRIQKILRKNYDKNPPVDERIQIQILKCKTASIQAKHQIRKVKLMKNTQNICFEQKKWIEQRIRKQVQQQNKWINDAVQKAIQYKLQEV